MTDERRKYYEKKYRHLNLYFDHGRGWDMLTFLAAEELDSMWPKWMPFWLKHFWVYSMGKGVRMTKFAIFLVKCGITKPVYNMPPRFTQIKEKFGGLRLYTSYTTPAIMSLENQSYNICEECGSRTDIGTTSGWIKTICKSCAQKSDNTYNNWKPRNNG